MKKFTVFTKIMILKYIKTIYNLSVKCWAMPRWVASVLEKNLQKSQMLFIPSSKGDAESDDSADSEHSAAGHRHAHHTFLLHTLVYLTLAIKKISNLKKKPQTVLDIET